MSIISFEEKLFPIGAQAWHAEHRLCRVIGAEGLKRTVSFTQKGSVKVTPRTAVVEVASLSRLPKISLKRKP